MFLRSNQSSYLALALAMTAATADTAYAQSAPAPSNEQAAEEPVEEIVVTGVRGSLASAIQAKRNSTAVIDSITAEDIGDFPDRNISEALQRVTGVTVFRSGAGEGRTISVRGAPSEFTQTTLNGITVASGNAGREFDFDVFASELFQNVTLTKSPTADIPEGGLAATVDLRTPRPFSFREPQLLASVSGQYAELGMGKIEPRFSALASTRLLDDRLGLLLSVSKSDLTSRGDIAQGFGFQTLRQAGWNPNTATGLIVDGINVTDRAELIRLSDNVLMPNLPRTGPEIKTLERLGVAGAVQFEATPDLTLGVDVLYADFSERNIRPTIDGSPGFGDARGLREIRLIDGFFAAQGTLDNVPQRSETADETFDSTLWHVTADASWDFSDNWTIAAKLGLSRAEEDELRRTYLYAYRDVFTYDLTDPNYPRFGSPNVSHLDVAAFTPNQLRFRPAHREDKVKVGRLEVTRAFDRGPIASIKAGASISEQVKSQTRGEARLPFTQPFTSAARPLLVSDFLDHAPAGTPNQYLMTDLDYGRTVLLPDDTPFPTDYPGVFEVKEKVTAGFVRSDWDFDLGGVRVAADSGLRVVKTDQTSDGYSIAGGQAVPISVTQSYTDILPNLNLKADLSDRLVARFTANRAMTRPTLTDLSPGASVDATQLRATIGNPELDPFRATQFDAGLEWYFAREGLLSATFFYKSIDSFVARISEREVLTGTNLINDRGQNVSGSTFDVTRPRNGEGGKLYGVELAYQQPFTFLPSPLDGLGVSANVTLSRSKGSITVGGVERTQRIPGQSNVSYNLVGYYEKYGFSLRAAWAHRSDYIESFPGALPNGTLLVQRTADRSQLDVSLRYDFSPNVALSFEALNLNGADFYSYIHDERLNRQRTYQGPVYLLSLSLKR